MIFQQVFVYHDPQHNMVITQKITTNEYDCKTNIIYFFDEAKLQ